MGLFRLLCFLWLVYMVGRFLRSLLQELPPDVPPGPNPFEPPQDTYYPFPPPPPPRPRAPAKQTPYEVLGVTSRATRAEIRQAYQQLIRQYHPDLVDGLGPELRELAERRTKEITGAYNALKRS